MNPKQYRELICRPTLIRLEMHSFIAEELMMLTVAHESEGFEYIEQLPHGPALGLPQIEPATARDIIFRYLEGRPDIYERFCYAVMWRREWAVDGNDRINERLIGDMAFGLALARIRYWMEPAKFDTLISGPGDVPGLAAYWKEYYQRGPDPDRGVEDAICDYNDYVKAGG